MVTGGNTSSPIGASAGLTVWLMASELLPPPSVSSCISSSPSSATTCFRRAPLRRLDTAPSSSATTAAAAAAAAASCSGSGSGSSALSCSKSGSVLVAAGTGACRLDGGWWKERGARALALADTDRGEGEEAEEEEGEGEERAAEAVFVDVEAAEGAVDAKEFSSVRAVAASASCFLLARGLRGRLAFCSVASAEEGAVAPAAVAGSAAEPVGCAVLLGAEESVGVGVLRGLRVRFTTFCSAASVGVVVAVAGSALVVAAASIDEASAFLARGLRGFLTTTEGMADSDGSEGAGTPAKESTKTSKQTLAAQQEASYHPWRTREPAAAAREASSAQRTARSSAEAAAPIGHETSICQEIDDVRGLQNTS
jgi:hypothetical protein